MERILSVEQTRAADEYTVTGLGLSREILTERAAAAVADEIRKRLYGGRVLVCVGKGNNGEDGRIIARMLSSCHGFTVATLNVYNGIFKLLDKKFDIIVDCIFGTGLNREVEGKYKEAIEKINASGAYVVSCDIASGLNGNTGRIMGAAVKANLTVAIQEYKLGHFLNDGPDYSGEIVARDIGISIWGDGYSKRLNDEDAAKFFPKRARNVNKGNFGKTAVFGGSKNFPGSALLSLSALSALRTGPGYSCLAVPECVYNAVAGRNPECTMTAFPDDGEKIVYDEEKIKSLFKYDSIAFGMGVGVNENVYKTLSYIIKNYTGNFVVDADGLNALSLFGTDILKEKSCKIVLTPHVGEFARLLAKDKAEVLKDPVSIATAFAKEFGVVLVLKNAVTVITDGEETYINTTGNQGMAKGGSGDVLSGVIAGILAGTDEILLGAASACYLFGKAGDIAEKKSNVYSLTATDVAEALPEAVSSVIR